MELQRSAPPTTPIYLSVVGLHSITLPQDPANLIADRRNMLAALLACGVDPERTTLYLQEQVPQHAELAWYFNTISSVGRLQRMTTWKSRLAVSRNANSEDEVSEADLRLGLFAYPVLQAADIALYKGTLVPVGEDQTQHLELARDTNEAFNRTFGDVFPIPDMQIGESRGIELSHSSVQLPSLLDTAHTSAPKTHPLAQEPVRENVQVGAQPALAHQHHRLVQGHREEDQGRRHRRRPEHHL
jgi:tryptophanyl-tRNA synthetase